MAQQHFLRDAMRRLQMSPDMFSGRLGAPRQTLDKWLLPASSKDFREMDALVWKFVGEIVEQEAQVP